MRFRPQQSTSASSNRRLAVRLALLLFVISAVVSTFIWRPAVTPGVKDAFDTELPPARFSELGDGVFTTDTGSPKAPPSEGGHAESLSELGVDQHLLERVLDKTSGIPERPYLHLVDVASRNSIEKLLEHAKPESQVTYAHLWSQPNRHRGALVYLEGHVRGLTRFEIGGEHKGVPATALYQAHLFTAAARPKPYIIIVPNVPKDMPQGMDILENVTFTGFFLKQWRYSTSQGVDRAAPLLIGRIVAWKPAPSHQKAVRERTQISVAFIAIILGVAVVLWALIRFSRRRPGMRTDELKDGASPAEVKAELAELEQRMASPSSGSPEAADPANPGDSNTP